MLNQPDPVALTYTQGKEMAFTIPQGKCPNLHGGGRGACDRHKHAVTWALSTDRPKEALGHKRLKSTSGYRG